MALLHENQAPESDPSFGEEFVHKQRRQMLIALTLLLAALILVVTKDRAFWFPPAPALQAESEPVEPTLPEPKAQSAKAIATPQPNVPAQKKSKSQSGAWGAKSSV